MSAFKLLESIHEAGEDPFCKYRGHARLRAVDVSWRRTEIGDPPADISFRSNTIPNKHGAVSSWLRARNYFSDSCSENLKLLIVMAEPSDRQFSSPKEILRMKIQQTDLKESYNAFGLPSTSLVSYLSSTRDFFTFPRVHVPGRPDQRVFSLSFGWWAISWTQSEDGDSSRGIALIRNDHITPIDEMFESAIDRMREFVRNPSFFGVVTSSVALTELSNFMLKNETATNELDNDMESYYVEDGRDDYVTARVDSGNIDMRHFWVSTHHDRLQVLQSVTKSIRAHNAIFLSNYSKINGRTKFQGEVIDGCVDHFDQKISACLLLARHLKERARLQQANVYNLLAQNDSRRSIEIAAASRSFAAASKKDQSISIRIAESSQQIALETKQDSNSMKTIAAVTMAFLPGTFVASLFATPMFQWDRNDGLQLSEQIWIYWAVTIPLTILTLGAWYIWLRLNVSREPARLETTPDAESNKM